MKPFQTQFPDRLRIDVRLGKQLDALWHVSFVVAGAPAETFVNRAPEIYDPLCFLEPKRSVRGMRNDVLDGRIGRKLGATFGGGPAFDLGDERTRHALAAPCRVDIQAFQERDRRAIRAVDVIDA